MRRAVIGSVLVAALVAGACSDKKQALGPTATVPQPTTTTDPYAVPPIIDEAYVNRVLAGLDHAVGEAVRLVVRTRLIDEEVFFRFKSAYIGDAFQLQLDLLQRDLIGGFRGYRDVPGDQTTSVVRLISVQESCVFAEVQKDFSAVGDTTISSSRQWVALIPLDGSRNTLGYNPTPWMFVYDGFREDRSQPPDPCAAES